MPIANSSVNIGGTCSVTGGTATSLLETGRDVDEFVGILSDGAVFNLRTTVRFTTKAPRVSASAPGGQTQARTTAQILKPKVLANGNRTVNTVKIEISVDPETTTAEIDSLRTHAAQLLFDSDYGPFWQIQALA